jgi:hypothetical protein
MKDWQPTPDWERFPAGGRFFQLSSVVTHAAGGQNPLDRVTAAVGWSAPR